MDIVLAGTGHRPPRLRLGYDNASRQLLRQFVKEQLEVLAPARVISGMAQGLDQALAEAALELGIPVTAAVPFAGQESRWPADAQRIYHEILKQTTVETIFPGGYEGWKFTGRDKWMVRNCNKLMALWDGEQKGGTWATVRFARDEGKRIVNIWDAWLVFRGK